MNYKLAHQVQIFKSVFKGRDDVFAIRWEKGKKSGYMPAFDYDPYMYRAHKMKGGTFQNYQDKAYLKLNDREIEKHIRGEQLMGIYPLLSDNTSWFLAADFDKDDWFTEARIFMKVCNEKGISTYLERSRSGNGGHVWIFFEQPYPAIRTRKIFISLLEQSGIFSVFDKGSSFDRLFPNQDFLSGKGLGNLIALPLFKKSFDEGNSCFIDTETKEPIEDQWNFLQNIRKNSISQLEELYSATVQSSTRYLRDVSNSKLSIRLSNTVEMSRGGITISLMNFLKDKLNFANSEFIIKKKIGKSTFGIDRYYKLIEETENKVIIPRGFVGTIIRFCRENKIDHEFIDERKKQNPVSYSFNAKLQEHQLSVIEKISKKDLGVIVAPPGSGKTVIGLKIISDKRQPALIVVHRKQLLEQWTERIEAFLGIPKTEIGKIGLGKNKVGEKITIATIQTLAKQLGKLESKNLFTAFGTIIVDECHHIPALTFRNAISKLQSYYLYGLTATPFRKYNDGSLIFANLGEIIAEVKMTDITTRKHPQIKIRNTELVVPFNPKTDIFETLSKILIHDSGRNNLILEDVKTELSKGKKVVIITERKEHIDSLFQYLKQSFEAITLSGADSESSRKVKWEIIEDGNYQVLITTGQYFGEGMDLKNANCLFLVYPFSFKGKLIQYIGRVQRSEITPVIYDYHDNRIEYLHKLFLKRNTFYRKIMKQATLFDDPDENEVSTIRNIITIDRKITVPVNKLDFRYGSIAFKFYIKEMLLEFEFEMENPDIRPEFEVLKPYFAKTLKSKNVKVDIHAEFENGKIISQLATSNNINKINRDLIDIVKFKFVSKNIFGKEPKPNENLLTIEDIQQAKQGNTNLYSDGEKLLVDLLKQKQYKHSRQLRYLSNKHEGTILKIRFVLNPFSFVFLLEGKEQFYIILETLDTEEATYLWHVHKNKNLLKIQLSDIDKQLTIIRNKGKQMFLETNPENFSRIYHDYSDDKKGFVLWRDLLDERIV